jgi:conjugal transfer pilus assembly protein TraK
MSYTILTLLSFLNESKAALQLPLNELKVIEAHIPKTDLTRITVEEDRILHVFGASGEYILEADEERGQIFIRPSEHHSTKPISLTITTEKGYTQDLRLIPHTKPPEALILKADLHLKEEIAKEKLSKTPIHREEIEELITACKENRIPLGYKSIPLDLSTLASFYPLIREIRGEKLRCLTYEVENSSRENLHLSEPPFATNPHTIAVLIQKKTLAPQERTEVYVVERVH